MNEQPDDELRARFIGLRALRTAQAGTFGAAIARARQRERRRSRTLAPLAVAAAAVLIVCNVMIVHGRARARVHADVALARQLVELVEWQSPTGLLLAVQHAAPFTLWESTIVPSTSPGELP